MEPLASRLFIHINEYYINVDSISYIKDAPTQSQVFFRAGDGKAHVTAVPKTEKSNRLMQALVNAVKIVDVLM